MCSCAMFRAEGHCIHKYAVEEIFLQKPIKGTRMPNAKIGQKAVKAGLEEESSSSSSSSSIASADSEEPLVKLPQKRGTKRKADGKTA